MSELGFKARLAGHTLNHLGYADGLCILSLTSAEKQGLLDRCAEYVLSMA